jgi:membrane associated rhomboid family serine protease
MVEMMRCYRHPDRETAVSCSECGRPICPECMVFAPVGIRCPDHSGQPTGVQRVVRQAQRTSIWSTNALVTKVLIAINVVVYLIGVADGGTINAPDGKIVERGILYGPLVAQGEWWRLITAAFLHASLLHIAFNMLALWWFGAALENALGRVRYLLLYLVSGLAGSAGAILLNPTTPSLGASGAIFGIFGAALVLERQRNYVVGGSALTVIVVNLIISFTVSGISIGGHLGGLAGGILATLALSRFGRGNAAYGRLGLVGIGSIVAIGVLSVAVAYWKVQGLVPG